MRPLRNRITSRVYVIDINLYDLIADIVLYYCFWTNVDIHVVELSVWCVKNVYCKGRFLLDEISIGGLDLKRLPVNPRDYSYD